MNTVGFPDSTVRESRDQVRAIRMRAWSSRSTTLSHLVPLREHYRSAELYTEARLKAKKANATVNRELELLRRALRLAKDRGLLLSLPKISLLPEHNTREGFLERYQMEALVLALPAYLQDYVRFGFITGMRKGEIISMRWANVDRAAGVVRLVDDDAKTGEGRTLALVGDLTALFERRWQDRLFTRVSGQPFVSELVFHRNGKPIGDFRRAWARACKAVGLPSGTKLTGGKTFHDLRRTSVRNMDRAGVPRRVAMAITGHKTESTYLRYRIVNEEDLRQAAQKNQFYLDTLPVTWRSGATGGDAPTPA